VPQSKNSTSIPIIISGRYRELALGHPFEEDFLSSLVINKDYLLKLKQQKIRQKIEKVIFTGVSMMFVKDGPYKLKLICEPLELNLLQLSDCQYQKCCAFYRIVLPVSLFPVYVTNRLVERLSSPNSI